MKRKLLILSLLFILSLSAACAADANESSTLSDPVSGSSFNAIQDAIDSSSQSETILLQGTYIGSGESITIDKPVTLKASISANLNANKKSRILDIKADDVTIENIAFAGGSDDEGGAINIEGSNIRIINCSFSSNAAQYGAGIASVGENVSIINCQFKKNTATVSGGAVEIDGNNSLVENCVFLNNYAGHVGGAVAWVGANGLIRNSTFQITIDPTIPSQYGGAIAWIGENGIIDKSVFDYNTANHSGAAVYWRGANGTLKNSIFANNTSHNDSACYGNPEIFINNYWGANFESDDEFAEGKLIYFNDTFHSPPSWANLIIEKYDVFFKRNDGEALNESLHDYSLTANGADIILKANHYQFKRSTSMTSSNMISYNKGEIFKVTLKDVDGNKIKNKQIQISIGGKTYNAVTDAGGVARLKLKTMKPGAYSLKAIFNGDSTYKASSKTVRVTVKIKKTSIKAKAKGKTIRATLKDQFKKPLKSKTLKLSINKKTYRMKTNSKGVAVFKIKMNKKGKFKFSIKFAGSSYYKKSSKSSYLKI